MEYRRTTAKSLFYGGTTVRWGGLEVPMDHLLTVDGLLPLWSFASVQLTGPPCPYYLRRST